MEQILDRLDRSSLDLQLILVAGRNDKLRRRLASRRTRIHKHVVGFTSEVPRWMRLADFFIGKPGPGSLSEATHMGLPAITVRNAWTLPQERFNADWLSDNGLGLVLKDFSGIDRAVAELLAGSTLARMRAATLAVRNRAIFEVPDLIETILARH
jgi:UDP-N-acetylglucosamine:LPS N-acetylglucosamine transferase